MTLSYNARPTYPVPPAGRRADALKKAAICGTFANFGAAR
jgi:hypothetical protein